MTKGERIDRVPNGTTEEKILRELPEVDAIYDEELREGVITAFLEGVPNYFWEKPSSSTGKYHSDDECGKYGNLIHTKRVFAEYCNISDTYREAGIISEYERECGKAAALIHDSMKYGWLSDDNEHTSNNHDLIAADMARNIARLPGEVCEMVARHMGPWGEGPLPNTKNEWLLHMADKSASGIPEDNRAIYYPSENIKEEWPDIIAIDHDYEDVI